MSAGFIACLIVAPLLLLLGGAVVWLGFYAHKRSKTQSAYDCWDSGRWFAWVIGGLILLGTLVGFSLGLYPYNMAYHSWRTHQGVVQVNTKVALDTDWVVTFQGSPVQFNCMETRCSDAKPGDFLKLRCEKQFAYSATASYACKFGRLDRRTP